MDGTRIVWTVRGVMSTGKRMRAMVVVLAAMVAAGAGAAPTDVELANRDGILLVGNNADPKALDPQLVTGVVESKIMTAIFEGLCGDDAADDDGCVPGVARSWRANADFTEWTFELNPEARWSDGQAGHGGGFPVFLPAHAASRNSPRRMSRCCISSRARRISTRGKSRISGRSG